MTATKSEDGKDFGPGDFAHVPDPSAPSTWKLRLTAEPGGAPDSTLVGDAAAALGKGFRGNKVDLPSADRAAVVARVRAAWKKANPGKPDSEMPDGLMMHAVEVTHLPRYAASATGFEIRDIEIFRTGKWKGDEYSTADLDEMVAAFPKVGFRPPVTLGHRGGLKPGEPAMGWIKSIRRQGSKLVADIMDLPRKVYDAIRSRGYDHVSAEVFWNLDRNGTVFPRVLKAIALLGAETPAVAGLRPLRDASYSASADAVRTIRLTVGARHMAKKTAFALALDARITELTEGGDERDDVLQTLANALDLEPSDIEAFADGTALPDEESVEAVADAFELDADELAEQFAAAKSKGKPKPKAKPKAKTHAIKPKSDSDGRVSFSNDEWDRISEGLASMSALQERLAEMETEVATERETRRAEQIATKTNALTIPALRVFVRPLYEIAYKSGKKVSFKLDGKNETPVDPVVIVDAMVAALNKRAEKLFGESARVYGRNDDGRRADESGDDESTQDKIARLAKDEMAKDKALKYDAAVVKVMDANPDLKAAYKYGR